MLWTRPFGGRVLFCPFGLLSLAYIMSGDMPLRIPLPFFSGISVMTGGDPSQAMVGEGDPKSASMEQAVYCRQIYREILAMEERVMEARARARPSRRSKQPILSHAKCGRGATTRKRSS